MTAAAALSTLFVANSAMAQNVIQLDGPVINASLYTIPENVTAISNAAHLTFTGSLVINGTLVGTGGGTGTFTLTAASITVGTHGLITTQIPAGMPGYMAQATPVNLNVISQANIVNAGLINASGNLNLHAAGGSIINSGVLNSLNGSVQFSTGIGKDLLVNNTSGAVTALLGSINLRDGSFTDKNATTLNGGTLSAQTLNVNGGNGLAKVVADQINATVNINAGDAHIYTETGTLNIASMNLSGDPTIVNNGGDIILTGNINANTLSFPGEHLAIIAAGSVLTSGGLSLIDLSSTTGNGGDLTIIAGFKVTPNPGSGTVTNSTTTYRLGAASGLPAIIDLDGVSINTSTSAAGKDGGRVVLAARDLTIGDNLASIVVGGIDTSASNGGDGGAVTVQALGDPIGITGPIKTAGTTGGAVTIQSGDITANKVSFKNGKMTGMIGLKTDLARAADIGLLADINASGTTKSGDVVVATPKNIVADVGVNITGNNVFLVANEDVLMLGGHTLTAAEDLALISNEVGSVLINSGSTFTAGNTILLAAANEIYDVGGSTYHAGDSVVFASQSHITIGDGSDFTASAGDIGFLSNAGKITVGNNESFVSAGLIGFLAGNGVDIGTGNNIVAGKLAPTAAPSGVLSDVDIVSSGAVIVLANSDININSSITSNGGDLLVAALGPGSDITLAPGTSFSAHGGYVTMFAGATINGDGNTFYSRAAGTRESFKGGLIELSAGFSFNPDLIDIGSSAAGNKREIVQARSQILSRAANLVKFATGDPAGFNTPELDAGGFILDPTIFGTPVHVNGNGLEPGLVLPNILNGGSVDLSGSTIDIARGATIFDAVGGSAHINMPNSTFKVESYDLLPTGFADNLVQRVDAFLNGLGTTLPDLTPDEQRTLASITITPKDQMPGFLLTPNNDDDQDGNGQQPDIKNKSLLGRVSMLAQRAGEHKYHSSAVVDTGKTEERTPIFQSGPSPSRPSTNRFMNRAELSQQVLNQLNFQQAQASGTPQPTIRVSERRPDVMLFTTTNQLMSGDLTGSPGTVVVGTHGTAISSTNDGVVLHTGAVVADSGDQPAKITTKAGKIKIDPNTTAAIVASADTGIRVVALAGSARDAKVTFTPHGEQEQSFDLKPGEELIVQARSVDVMAKSNLPPSDFVANELAGALPRPSIRLTGARSEYLRMVQRLEDTLQAQAGAHQIDLFGKAVANSVTPARIVASDGTLIRKEGDGVVALEFGSVFTTSATPIEVKTDLATIKAKARAQMSIDAGPGTVRIRACSGPGHVEVDAANKKIFLNPGEEILLADERPTKSDALGSDGLGRRQLSVERVSDRIWAVTGDFSIASMLNGANYIMPIRKAEDESSKRIVSDLMKMHASLEFATGMRGRYYAQPKQTAHVPDGVFRNGGDGA